jgi:hypothetical protein
MKFVVDEAVVDERHGDTPALAHHKARSTLLCNVLVLILTMERCEGCEEHLEIAKVRCVWRPGSGKESDGSAVRSR